MMRLTVAATACVCASALNAPVAPRVRAPTPRMSAADGMEGAAHETGFTTWDPLGLADLGSPATLSFFRHAELKHGRVAMAAFVGWLVASAGVHFPGTLSLSENLSFEDISKLAPLEQWAALPALSKAQIFLWIGLMEGRSESIKPHYMSGGVPGSLKELKGGLPYWDPVGFTSKLDAEKLKRQRLAELKNGRLAMLGIVSVLIANKVPGSIPVPINFPDSAGIVMPF